MISVIVPAYNEERLLPLCLASLTRQTTSRSFEVIIVDNASTDATRRVAKQFQNRLRVRIISESTKGRGAARAAGFAAATGSILLSTDADTVVPEDWVDTLAQELEKPGVEAVIGTATSVDGGRLTNACIFLFQPVCMHVYRMAIGHYWLSGFNFGIARRIYQKAGGFNRRLNAYEDIDLGMRVQKHTTIRYLSTPKVVFSARRFRGGVFAGMKEYVGGAIDYFFRHRSNVIITDVREP